MPKIMEIIAKETNGKSYNTEKYSYDSVGVPSFDYDDSADRVMKWKESAETETHKIAVSLIDIVNDINGQTPLFTYFLDGSSLMDHQGRPNANYIADLPLFHRTPAALYSNQEFLGDVKFAVWYVRIRDKKQTRTPFDGVVKVEKILMPEEEGTGLDSEIIDMISAHIITERNPTCYGTDKRWANHLEEIDYTYPANNAYFAYMTRGCVNKCPFCAVPTLEPKYRDYIGIKDQIEIASKRFGEQRRILYE